MPLPKCDAQKWVDEGHTPEEMEGAPPSLSRVLQGGLRALFSTCSSVRRTNCFPRISSCRFLDAAGDLPTRRMTGSPTTLSRCRLESRCAVPWRESDLSKSADNAFAAHSPLSHCSSSLLYQVPGPPSPVSTNAQGLGLVSVWRAAPEPRRRLEVRHWRLQLRNGGKLPQGTVGDPGLGLEARTQISSMPCIGLHPSLEAWPISPPVEHPPALLSSLNPP